MSPSDARAEWKQMQLRREKEREGPGPARSVSVRAWFVGIMIPALSQLTGTEVTA